MTMRRGAIYSSIGQSLLPRTLLGKATEDLPLPAVG